VRSVEEYQIKLIDWPKERCGPVRGVSANGSGSARREARRGSDCTAPDSGNILARATSC
jgi:hypothetical protein